MIGWKLIFGYMVQWQQIHRTVKGCCLVSLLLCSKQKLVCVSFFDIHFQKLVCFSFSDIRTQADIRAGAKYQVLKTEPEYNKFRISKCYFVFRYFVISCQKSPGHAFKFRHKTLWDFLADASKVPPLCQSRLSNSRGQWLFWLSNPEVMPPSPGGKQW